MIGQMLGPYRILENLGAGGMGEVYKARDTRLGRTVAIKVLRPPVGAAPDPSTGSGSSRAKLWDDRRRRFEQEARAVSALNHSNICVLHDIGREGDTDFLVMELLEGHTLAHRLRKGPLPLDLALDLGAQIAGALAAAHKHGIVHRDLKPANIMLVKSGGGLQAKLLDFGLAKFKGEGAAFARVVGGPSALPTEEPATATGAVMGTAPYMAPEQFEGKEADARTDLFAFGCVLYEMLTGRRAFGGEREASVISGIVSSQPTPVSILQPVTPPAIVRLVQRCLMRDPDSRAQSAHDIGDELRSLAETLRASTAVSHPRRHRLRWDVRAAALLVVVLSGAAAATWALWPPSGAAPVPRRLTLTLPPDLKLQVVSTTPVAFAPDGTGAVLALRPPDTIAWHLYWFGLTDSAPQELPGTEGGHTPFFSPDGKWLGFSRGQKLLKVPFASGRIPAGSSPTQLASVSDFQLRGASWGDDGTILFCPQSMATGLWRVSAEGGEAREVTRPNPARRELSHRWPQFLPGGRAALFTVNDASGRPDRGAVAVLSLEDGRWTRIIEGGTHGRFVPSGHIVYGRNGALLAVPFDPVSLRVTGPSVPVLTGVAMAAGNGLAGFDVSAGGSLIHAAGSERLPKHSLVWLGRDGHVEPVTADVQAYRPNFDLSRDGMRLVLSVQTEDGSRLWIYHLTTGQWQQLTSDADNDAMMPVWSPQGDRVVFASNAAGAFNLYLVRTDGEGLPERLTQSDEWQVPFSWSPDGRFIAYQQQHAKTSWSTFILPLDGHGGPRRWDREGASVTLPAFSPDGRWLAYQSFESGGPEVYVRPFPGPGEKVLVSGKEGGYAPVWSRDGLEILYLPRGTVDNRILGARVQPGRVLRVLGRHVAFAPPFPLVPHIPPYYRVIGLSPDGRRILTIRPDPQRVDPITYGDMRVITDWAEEVKAKVGR